MKCLFLIISVIFTGCATQDNSSLDYAIYYEHLQSEAKLSQKDMQDRIEADRFENSLRD